MTTPRPRKAAKTLPAWAIALKVRRAALGKSQEQVALDSGILNQTTVSELEGGRYEVSNLAIARLAGLARGLEWTLAELEAALGLDFDLGSLEQADKPRRPGPPSVAPVVPFRQTRITIPRELQEMVEKHGDAYPVLKTEQMQRMLAAPRNFGGAEVGPQTAEDWFDYWMANKRFLT